MDFTRIVPKAGVDFTHFTEIPPILAQNRAGAGYADLTGMKPSNSTVAPEQPPVSGPTKSIVRCCEQRKRRDDLIAALRETQRIRIKLGK